jgi:hypothetical protein
MTRLRITREPRAIGANRVCRSASVVISVIRAPCAGWRATSTRGRQLAVGVHPGQRWCEIGETAAAERPYGQPVLWACSLRRDYSMPDLAFTLRELLSERSAALAPRVFDGLSAQLLRASERGGDPTRRSGISKKVRTSRRQAGRPGRGRYAIVIFPGLNIASAASDMRAALARAARGDISTDDQESPMVVACSDSHICAAGCRSRTRPRGGREPEARTS